MFSFKFQIIQKCNGRIYIDSDLYPEEHPLLPLDEKYFESLKEYDFGKSFDEKGDDFKMPTSNLLQLLFPHKKINAEIIEMNADVTHATLNYIWWFIDDWLNEIVEPPMPPHSLCEYDENEKGEEEEKIGDEMIKEKEQLEEPMGKGFLGTSTDSEFLSSSTLSTSTDPSPFLPSAAPKNLCFNDEEKEMDHLTEEMRDLEKEELREGSSAIRISFGRLFVRFSQSSDNQNIFSYYLPFCCVLARQWTISTVKVFFTYHSYFI